MPAHQVTREFEVFAILVNDNLQSVRVELSAAIEVRDNFNESFSKRGLADVAQVVSAMISYNPKNVVSENQ